MKIYEIETPALLIDLDVMKRNSDLMMSAINKSPAALRPHFKSHKCTEIAKFQLEHGAKGLTCAKLSEAEAIIGAGIDCDILIANQIVEKSKLERLAALCAEHTVSLCVDSAENVYSIEAAMAKQNTKVGALIEYEIGMERCGVLTEEAFFELYKAIEACPHVCFRGIQAYAGHISHEADERKRLSAIEENNKRLLSLLAYLKERGVHPEIISGASTGTAQTKMNQGIYNEIQAGSYLLLDDCYNKMGLPLQNSLFVLTSVVSAKEGLAVVDAGVKTVGVDQGLPTALNTCCSHIVASEEHFQLHHPSRGLQVGEKIKLIPGHCCSTMNLHESVYLVRGDEVVQMLSIDGRGCGK